MNNLIYIQLFIEKCIATQKVDFAVNQIDNYSELIEDDVVYPNETDPHIIRLNPDSFKFNQALLKIAEKKLGRKVPKSIVEAYCFIDDFQEKLKEENGIAKNVLNGYDEIIKGFQGYILYHLDSLGLNIKDFYLKELKSKDEREGDLFLFEQHLYRFLSYSNYTPNEVWEICQETLSTDDAYYAGEFAKHLAGKNYGLARELYGVASESNYSSNSLFIAHLLIGLHNNGLNGVFEKAVEMKNAHPQQSYYVLNSLKDLSASQNKFIFDLVSNDNSEEYIWSKAQTICGLIEKPEVNEKLRQDCFSLLNTYLQFKNKDTKKVAFRAISYNLKTFETEKYKLLHTYLDNTADLTVINTFFLNFKNPKYLFELIISVYRVGWQRGTIKLFEDSIFHFWKKDQLETEKHILSLFRPEDKMGMLPVEIIMTGNFGALPIDLLKLASKQEQVKAIEAITLYPHSFERLLPIILPLRHSVHPEVVKFLQSKLSELIYDAYHKSILDDIEAILNDSREDKEFAAPLIETFKQYETKIAEKESINDIDPYENERNLMDLHYNLEQENRAIMMQDVNAKGGLAAIGKTTVIVRGNSWKEELEDEVRPLSRIKAHFSLDARLYKNPDLQEYILNSYDKR